MQKEQYQLMFDQDKKHWWYVGNRIIIFSLLEKYWGKKTGLRILDAGCGTGMNMIKLSRFGTVHGIDASDEALEFCKLNNLKNLKNASVEDIPFNDNSFDLVTSFEVLYHKNVKDYNKAIIEFYRVLDKGGLLVLRLPAFNMLYGGHDVVVHGARRFTIKQVENSVISAGFKIEKITYVNFISFFPVLILRTIQRAFGLKKNKADTSIEQGLLNTFLIAWLQLEARFLNHFNIPLGVSVLCIARK